MEDVIVRSKKLRVLWLRFYGWAIGVFFAYTAYSTVVQLQSSINVQKGLGSVSVGCTCLSGAILAISLVPGLQKSFGAKKCVWWGEIGHFLFTLVNLQAKWYTMIPASVFVGLGDALLWSSIPIINICFSQIYGLLLGESGSKDIYSSMFHSYFFGVMQSSKIFGNLISYGVLYGFDSHTSENATRTNMNSSTDYAHCGANDCLQQTVIEDTLDKYVPSNVWTTRFLLIAMALLGLLAIIIHTIIIPEDLASFGVTHRCRKRDSCKDIDSGEPSVPLEPTKCQDSSDENNLTYSPIDPVIGNRSQQDQGNIRFLAKTAVKNTMFQLFRPAQMLLNPMHLYCGMTFAFVSSEITRSYTSCVFGVSWMPLHSAFYGLGASLVSFITGKLIRRVQRHYLIILATIVDIGTLVYCRWWSSSIGSHMSVIIIYFLLGAGQGIWSPLSQALQNIVFPDRMNINSSIWIFWFLTGMGVQFAWSSSVCVYVEIYAQMIVLVMTVFGYVCTEKLMKKMHSGAFPRDED